MFPAAQAFRYVQTEIDNSALGQVRSMTFCSARVRLPRSLRLRQDRGSGRQAQC